MNVVQLIQALEDIRAAGGGQAEVVIEEEGEGYFGRLLDVDTWLVTRGMHGPQTITLLGETDQ